MQTEKDCIAKKIMQHSCMPDTPTQSVGSFRMVPIMLAQAAGLLFGLIGVRLSTRLVAPADYGLYGVFVSLAPLGYGVVFIGLVKYLGRQWLTAPDRPALLHGTLDRLRRKSLWLVLVTAAAALVTGQMYWFWAALLLSTMLLTLYQLAQTALQAAQEHWRDFTLSVGSSAVRAVAPPLLYAATGAGLSALMGGFLLHAMLGAVLGAMLMKRWWPRTTIRAGTELESGSIYEGPLFVILAIAGWILSGLNRWLAALFFGAEQAGYFTLAANIATILPSMLGTMALQYFQPVWFARPHSTPEERGALLRQVDQVAAAYTAFALTATFTLQFVLPWLYGPLINYRYASAASFVLCAGLSTTAVTLGFFYHTMLLAARRERACGPADLAGAAALITGSVLAAAAGQAWFVRWLLLTPLLPWLVNRSIARHCLLSRA